MPTEAALEESFQLYKGTGILVSLVLIFAFQLLFPNRLSLRDLLHNWKVNAPLALIDTGLVSLLCGACICTWAASVRERGIGLFEVAALPYWIQVAATVVLLENKSIKSFFIFFPK